MFLCPGNRQQAYDTGYDMNMECALCCLYLNAQVRQQGYSSASLASVTWPDAVNSISRLRSDV